MANLKPLFSDKVNNRETINLFDNGVTLAKDKEIFNKYFCNIAKNLSLLENPFELFTDPAIIALEQYIDHGSITSIKNKMTSMDNPKFSFRFVSINETWDRVNKLSPVIFFFFLEIGDLDIASYADDTFSSEHAWH